MNWQRAGPICFILLGIACPVFSQETKTTSAEEIMMKFIQKFMKESNGLTYEEIEVDEYFKDGVLDERESRVSLVERSMDKVLKTLIEKNGHKLKNDRPEPKEDLLPIDERLVLRYSFVIDRTEIMNGRRCWVFSFKPRGGYLKRDDKDKILNRLSGHIWIAQNDLSLILAQASLVEPTMIIGFFAKVYQLDCEIRTKMVRGHSWIGSVRAEVRYGQFRIFGYAQKHLIKSINYRNHKRKEEQ